MAAAAGGGEAAAAPAVTPAPASSTGTEGKDCPCHTAERRPPTTPIALHPRPETLEEGKDYYFCVCGESKKFPFCDGAHRAFNAAHGTSYRPRVIKAAASGEVYLCQCGHSANYKTWTDGSTPAIPTCTGAHKHVVAAKA